MANKDSYKQNKLNVTKCKVFNSLNRYQKNLHSKYLHSDKLCSSFSVDLLE